VRRSPMDGSDGHSDLWSKCRRWGVYGANTGGVSRRKKANVPSRASQPLRSPRWQRVEEGQQTARRRGKTGVKGREGKSVHQVYFSSIQRRALREKVTGSVASSKSNRRHTPAVRPHAGAARPGRRKPVSTATRRAGPTKEPARGALAGRQAPPHGGRSVPVQSESGAGAATQSSRV